MQLVGATWWFIRWPFLMEGLFFGVIGAVISYVIIIGILLMMSQALKLSELTLVLPYNGIDITGILAGLAIMMIGLGASVGFFGSLKTVNTFLGRDKRVHSHQKRATRTESG